VSELELVAGKQVKRADFSSADNRSVRPPSLSEVGRSHRGNLRRLAFSGFDGLPPKISDGQRLADDPQIQVKLAMGHLEAAHSGYHQDYAHAGLLKKTVRFDLVWQAATKDFWTNCFLAICYADLGQARLVKHHLQFACHARSVALKMCKVDSDDIFKTIESGSTWDKINMINLMGFSISLSNGIPTTFKDPLAYTLAYNAIYADYSIYRINVVPFEEFCSQLTGCPWRIADHESEPSTNE